MQRADLTTGPRTSAGRDRFPGWFGKILLPGIVLQSVLIGGGYATGREIVEYGAKYGPQGWVAIVVIFFGFTLASILTFEVARVFRAYEYKGFMRRLIGPVWPVFDLLFAAMVILTIAVMASAATNIMKETMGVPEPAGTAVVIAAVALLLYLGAAFIEAFKSVGTAMLYSAYVIFGVMVLSAGWDRLDGVFSADGASYLAGADTGDVLFSGVLYVGYNLAAFPAVLFTLHRQVSRRETMIAGLVAGLLMTFPFALTWLSLMTFYPDPAVLEAPVPWLRMLADLGGGPLVVVFGLVMGWTLLETSVGLTHALLDRIDRDLKQATLRPFAGSGGLSPLQNAFLGAAILVFAAILSGFGIIALVARGYAVMGYLFIALFGLPLLFVGTFRILRAGRSAGDRNL